MQNSPQDLTGAMVVRSPTSLFIASIILLLVRKNNAFSPSDVFKRSLVSPISTQQQKSIILSQSFMPFADATEPKNSGPIEQKDANGKIISPGVIVAIAPDTRVKAHQVPKAAFGSFDEKTNKFVPADESIVSRATSCLILSEGIRGEVTKVYNVNEWDRAHPILVQFKEGLDREEGEGGFDLPKPFMMHFSANEIIVVD